MKIHVLEKNKFTIARISKSDFYSAHFYMQP